MMVSGRRPEVVTPKFPGRSSAFHRTCRASVRRPPHIRTRASARRKVTYRTRSPAASSLACPPAPLQTRLGSREEPAPAMTPSKNDPPSAENPHHYASRRGHRPQRPTLSPTPNSPPHPPVTNSNADLEALRRQSQPNWVEGTGAYGPGRPVDMHEQAVRAEAPCRDCRIRRHRGQGSCYPPTPAAARPCWQARQAARRSRLMAHIRNHRKPRRRRPVTVTQGPHGLPTLCARWSSPPPAVAHPAAAPSSAQPAAALAHGCDPTRPTSLSPSTRPSSPCAR